MCQLSLTNVVRASCARAARACEHRRTIACNARPYAAVAAVRELPTVRSMSSTPLLISQRVRASISSDGLVLLDLAGGLVLSANHVGARIWQLLDARTPLDDLARRLAVEYDVTLDRASRDLDAFVSALAARGLVRAEDAR